MGESLHVVVHLFSDSIALFQVFNFLPVGKLTDY